MSQKQQIIPPNEGWKAHSLYRVNVSFRPTNPMHESYFWSGFLDETDYPSGYNQLWNSSYDLGELFTISDVYQMEVVELLHTKTNFG